MPRIGDLINAIRTAMPNIPTPRKGRGLRSVWPRPPLILDESYEVGGINLQEFVRPTMRLAASDYRAIFEAYAETYIGGEGDPETIPEWMAEQLNLNERLAEWYFPKGITLDPVAHHLAVFLWLGSYAKWAGPFDLGYGLITLQLPGDVTIGVKEGMLLSRFTKVAVPEVDYTIMLEGHHTVGKPRRSLDNALSTFWVATHQAKGDVREPLQLALRLLYYKFGHLGRLTDYLYKGYERKLQCKGLKPICRDLLDHLTTVPNPAVKMYEDLVLSYRMDDEDFEKRFKNGLHFADLSVDTPVGTAQVSQWHQDLTTIIKEAKNDK